MSKIILVIGTKDTSLKYFRCIMFCKESACILFALKYLNIWLFSGTNLLHTVLMDSNNYSLALKLTIIHLFLTLGCYSQPLMTENLKLFLS